MVPTRHPLLLNSGVHLCPPMQNPNELIAKYKLIARWKCELCQSYRISWSENDAEEAFKFYAKPLINEDLAILDLKKEKGKGDDTADTQKGTSWLPWINEHLCEKAWSLWISLCHLQKWHLVRPCCENQAQRMATEWAVTQFLAEKFIPPKSTFDSFFAQRLWMEL